MTVRKYIKEQFFYRRELNYTLKSFLMGIGFFLFFLFIMFMVSPIEGMSRILLVLYLGLCVLCYSFTYDSVEKSDKRTTPTAMPLIFLLSSVTLVGILLYKVFR